MRKGQGCARSCSQDATAVFTFLSSSSRAEQSVRRSCLCGSNGSGSVPAAQASFHISLLAKGHLSPRHQLADHPPLRLRGPRHSTQQWACLQILR